MKTNIIKTVVALIGAGATSVFAAATGAAGEASGLLVWFLIGFGALVIMLQVMPAIVLFVSMLRGLFAVPGKEVHLPKV